MDIYVQKQRVKMYFSCVPQMALSSFRSRLLVEKIEFPFVTSDSYFGGMMR